MKWYVIRVISGKEKKLKETIENELKKNNFDEKINQILVPTHKTIQVRKGKKYNIEKNFFPGYILIECDFISEISAVIKNINGVSGFLGSGKSPQPLSDSEIDRILGRQNQKIEDFYVGQVVKIMDGPFATFCGNLTDIDASKQKVKLNVKIFGRDVPLELTYQQIEK